MAAAKTPNAGINIMFNKIFNIIEVPYTMLKIFLLPKVINTHIYREDKKKLGKDKERRRSAVELLVNDDPLDKYINCGAAMMIIIVVIIDAPKRILNDFDTNFFKLSELLFEDSKKG